jgi:dolichol-phosphate mannosyltransferase
MLLDLACALVLGAFGAMVVVRMARGIRATRIVPVAVAPPAASITAIVPVLDEAARIAPCLSGLVRSGPEVGEILLVDGGSRDETLAIVRRFAKADPRVRAIDASPVPPGWNGKAWGLDVGLRAANPAAQWILTVDADVRPAAGLPAAMVAHANVRHVAALSVATRQLLADPLQAVLHPAMLATLIYRFGLPGREATRVGDVQANGQCFLATRALLLEHGAFGNVRASRCEDVTLARALVAVLMHADWRETWCNWPRSLTLRDRFARFGGWPGILDVLLVQALPLPLLAALAFAHASGSATFAVAAALVLMRAGVLAGAARAYVAPPWTYWLSPLADLPVALALIAAALRRRHTWRGRELVPAGVGG